MIILRVWRQQITRVVVVDDVRDSCADVEKWILHHCTVVYNPEDEDNSEN